MSDGDIRRESESPGHRFAMPTASRHQFRLMRTRIVRDYRTRYANPIRFAQGEIVTLGGRDTEWPAFIWATTVDGNAGWAPFDWLKPLDDNRAEALRDYSAQELDVDAGDEVTPLHELGGWWWCERADGRCGWVPAEHLERA